MTLALAPVVLFTYNRPDHTRRALAALAANALAKDSDLYVYSDGPKSEGQEDAIAAVRAVLSDVTGFKSVTVIEREKNHGLAANIVDGVTRLCEQNGRVIVLEDDLIASRQFLNFMNAALQHYADEDKVMQISGHSFLDRSRSMVCPIMPMITSWGWGTWKRAWKHFDPNAFGFEEIKKNRELRDSFDFGGAYPYFNLLKKQVGGEVNSWAILWYLSVFMREGLVVFPPSTLIHNIGFDGSGTHCRNSGEVSPGIDFRDIQFSHFPKPEITPGAVEDFCEAMRKDKDQFFGPSVYIKIKHILKILILRIGIVL